MIDKHAAKSQTSASLMTLMKTGRGELLEKMSDIAELAMLTNNAAPSRVSNNRGGGGDAGGVGGRSLGVDPPPGHETYEDSYPLMDGQKSKVRKEQSTSRQLQNSGSTNSSSSSSNNNISSSSSSSSSSSEATPLVLLQVASFLRRELPIRFAHRINDLGRVPLLRDMSSVREVRALYITSFLEILTLDKHPPPSSDTSEGWENSFAAILENIYERHSSVLVQMAKGAYELRAAIRDGADGGLKGATTTTTADATTTSSSSSQREAIEFELMEGTHAFLDRFYISRIGMRVLIGQYLSLRQPPVENYVGIICGRTSPYEIVKRAIDDAAFMCTRKYGDAPEVIITGRLDMTFPYVPTHLHYIMLELLKNSMRATVEYHGVDADYPPIKVVIADGSDNEDVIIKVSDEGGGIPRSNMKRIWSYLFTTADPEVQEGMVAFNENVDHSIDSPLAGLGYGLPISRSYARYFGGDLSIMSMEGYGTDCFVYLTRLGNTKEPLPI